MFLGFLDANMIKTFNQEIAYENFKELFFKTNFNEMMFLEKKIKLMKNDFKRTNKDNHMHK